MTHLDQANNILYVGHNTFFFTFISVISVFAMDMARFKKWSLSTARFTSASIIGMLVGILLMDLLPEGNASINMALSVIATITVSAFLALKLQTLDEPIQRKSRGLRQ
tara:strand:+ start:1759 stop:2082 length:324 start_codon:yes stop_codon:yes gene_type:complete